MDVASLGLDPNLLNSLVICARDLLVGIGANLFSNGAARARQSRLEARLVDRARLEAALESVLSPAERFETVAADLARAMRRLHCSQEEQSLVALLIDPLFRDDLAQWFLSPPAERATARSRLQEQLLRALQRNGLVGADADGQVDAYLRRFELRVAADPVLAHYDAHLRLVALQSALAAPAAPHAPVLHQIGSAPPEFTGRRRELGSVGKALRRPQQRVCVLVGPGGAGKTAMAVRIAEDLRDLYPDAQIVLDLQGASRSPVSAAEAMAHVIRSFEPLADLPPREASLMGRFHDVLDGKRVLLLMDNAADARQLQPLLPPVGSLLLVTSRFRIAIGGAEPVDVGGLQPSDARGLLVKLSRRTRGYADEIAKLCGYLPLALRCAGTALAESPDLSPEEYLARLAQSSDRLDMLDQVRAALQVSYDLLPQGMQPPWRALTVFPQDFDALGAAAVWELPGLEARELLRGFVTRSMAEWHAGASRYRLHDLARLFASKLLKQAERGPVGFRHASYYLGRMQHASSLCGEFPVDRGPHDEALAQGIALFHQESSNIRHAHDWACRRAETDDSAAMLCSTCTRGRSRLFAFVTSPHEALQWVEAALRSAECLHSEDECARHRTDLALFCTRADRHQEAADLLSDAADSRRAGGDGERAQALLVRGLAHTELLQPDLALEDLRLSAELAKANQQHHVGYLALLRLAVVQHDLGRADLAQAAFREASVAAHDAGHDRGELAALQGVASCLIDLGDTELGLEYARRAREARERRDDFPVLTGTLCTEADWRAGCGDADEAETLLRRAQVAHARLLKRHHERRDRKAIGETSLRLAVLARRLGQLPEAQTRVEEALRTPEEHAHPMMLAGAYLQQGHISQDRGDLPAARAAFTEAFDRYSAARSRDAYRWSAYSAYCLGSCILRQAREASSQDLRHESKTWLERALGRYRSPEARKWPAEARVRLAGAVACSVRLLDTNLAWDPASRLVVGSPIELAEGKCLAALAEAHYEGGDCEGARNYALDARGLFERLPASGDLARVRQLLGRISCRDPD